MSSIIKKTLEERKNLSQKYMDINRNNIPIILLNKNNKDNKKLKVLKNKYLVKKNYKINEFILKLKEVNKINKDCSIILKSKNIILKNDAIFENIYEKYKDNDGFLYMELIVTESFGNKN